MIIYNTLMGVCAGFGLLTVANLLRLWHRGELYGGGRGHQLRYQGMALLITGLPLTFLAAAMTVTWPLNAEPPVNVAFGEPSLMLGLLMVAAGSALCFSKLRGGFEVHWPGPVMWVVFVVGMVLAAISSAIFSYGIIGDAPPQEPITSRATGWEQPTFGVVYALAALGCLLAPAAKRGQVVWRLVWLCWVLSGVFFLLFSVLNYRTHLGLLTNFGTGSDYRW